MSGHGWGFCEAEEQMPEILFQRIVPVYVSLAYYAGVAMVGKRFQKDMEVINVDAWKEAFDETNVSEVFEFFFCDALPKNYKQIIADEIRKHPLRGVAPATIPLSTATAKEQWGIFSERFGEIEKEIQEWAAKNLDKLPNSSPNFEGLIEDDPDEM